MSVELLPPMTYSTGMGAGPRPEPLRLGPRFVRSRNMSRWHRVRSGVRYPTHTSWHFWCGQGSNSAPVITRDDDPADSVPVCGSCEGRAIGAGHEENDGPRDLTFTPAQLRRPRWCPGSRSELYEPIADPRGWPRLGVCLVCGAAERIIAGGGPYNPNVGLRRHEPVSLVQGCSLHGWRCVGRLSDGDVGCYACGEPLGGAA